MILVVNCARYADDRYAAVGTVDGAWLIDWRAGSPDRRIYTSPGAYAHAVSYSPDHSLLALGTSDGRVILLETEFYEMIFEFQAHLLGRDFIGRESHEPQYNYVRDIRWSSDGSILITGPGDGTVRAWDALRLGESRRARIAEDRNSRGEE
ncbi:MAG: hypothetical protein H6819_01200 [Phycisphaerales bacterium]|nr:hypothetical protein [Phycisphaerales bacterium]MCB9857175.1 hypothetical protein [Phycisphaerales bacterium]